MNRSGPRRDAWDAAIMQFVLLALAFIALTMAFVSSDFSVLNVWQNSHTDKPLLYKMSGVWGNHEPILGFISGI